MPIQVLSVRVREHPHEERTPSGVVPRTAVGRDEEMNRQETKESE